MDTVAAIPQDDMTMMLWNKTLICQNPYKIHPKGIWFHDNPLEYSASLLLMQLSLISIVTQLINYCLKPLGQSIIVSQIVGGIILGPSALGHEKAFSSTLFPLRGMQILETIATFGLMLFLFMIALKVDPAILKKAGRMTISIGVSVFFISLIIPVAISLILKYNLPMTPSLAHSLPFIAGSQSLLGFPVIACLLMELRIINTDLGRLSIAVSIISDIIHISLTSLILCFTQSKDGNVLKAFWSILSTVAMVAFIILCIRPVMLWILRQTPEGKPVKEVYIFSIFVAVLGTGFLSEAVGQHYVLGPMVLGFMVPDGPPIGAALFEKLDSFVLGILYPTFLAVCGLKTNMFSIRLQASWIIFFIVFIACMTKIAATMVPSLYFKMPVRDSLVVGLILNTRGVCALVLYNIWRDDQTFGEQEFALTVVSIIGVTGIVTPLIRALYNPSDRYMTINRRTIQHAKRDAELRLLVCIHNQENVPTIVNLLEVSNATRESPVAVILLLLVQLVGRALPVLVAHQPQGNTLSSSSSRSDRVINAFRNYEVHNQGNVGIETITAMTNLETMHEDVCQVALDKRVTMIIIPFHKQWAIDGSVESVNRGIGSMNLNILKNAPCSVGILIDRGILKESLSVPTTRSFYRVVVLFVGGTDDAEALAYGARMAKHKNVNLTIVRFLLFGNDSARERKLDGEMIDEFRKENADNGQFGYREEVVRDGEGLATVIQGMEVGFDLMIVGRYHQKESPLMSGLNEWSECPELGIIGDMLASPDFGTTASVLVVQQQARVRGNLNSYPSFQPVVQLRDPLVHDLPEDVGRNISSDRSSSYNGA